MSYHIQINQNRRKFSLCYNKNIRFKILDKIASKFSGKLPTGIFNQLSEM